MHKTVVCSMKVSGTRVAEFVDPESVPAEVLALGSQVVSFRFSKYETGQIVNVTFRYSEKLRHILNITEGDDSTPPVSDKTCPLLDGEFTDSGVWIGKKLQQVLANADAAALKFGAANVMLLGAAGTGKTTTCRAFAEVTGRDFLRVNLSAIRDEEEWFGWRTIVDGDIKFIPTPFTELMVHGNAVLLMDDWNRMASSRLHNAAFSILDDSRAVDIFGQRFVVGDNVVFIAARNEGSRYVGTVETDSAADDRFDYFYEMKRPPKNVEAQILTKFVSRSDADKIVAVMSALRASDLVADLGVEVETRRSISIARIVAAETGISVQKAFEIGFIDRFQEERKSIQAIIASALQS